MRLREMRLLGNLVQLYNLDEHFSASSVLILKLYRPYNQIQIMTDREWQLFKGFVKDIVKETIETLTEREQNNICILAFERDDLPILIKNLGAERAKSLAIQLARYILQNVSRFLRFEMNVAIGNWTTVPMESRRHYDEVIRMLRTLEFEGYNKIGLIDETDFMLVDDDRYPRKLVQQCFSAIQKRNPIEITKQWDKLKHWIMQDNVTVEITKIVCISFWSHLLVELVEEEGVYHNEILPVWFHSNNNSRSKERIIEWINDYFYTYLNILVPEKSQQQLYVKEMIQYIEGSYAKTITLNALSRKLHLTRGYLSHLFKQELGVSFNQYLTNYRIERAKELLLTNQYMVYEVSELVGYTDPAYFSRVFKKVTGYTPQQYVNLL